MSVTNDHPPIFEHETAERCSLEDLDRRLSSSSFDEHPVKRDPSDRQVEADCPRILWRIDRDCSRQGIRVVLANERRRSGSKNVGEQADLAQGLAASRAAEEVSGQRGAREGSSVDDEHPPAVAAEQRREDRASDARGDDQYVCFAVLAVHLGGRLGSDVPLRNGVIEPSGHGVMSRR